MIRPYKIIAIAHLVAIMVFLSAPVGAQSSGWSTKGGIVLCADEEPDRRLSSDEREIGIKDGIAAPLVSWIVARAGWTASGSPPLRFISDEEMASRFAGGRTSGIHVEALYSDKDHVIYLPLGWNKNNLRDRSALLHELVHHLQYLNKIKATCRAEYEMDSYKLQIDWLREQGIEDPLNFLGINMMFIRFVSTCPEF